MDASQFHMTRLFQRSGSGSALLTKGSAVRTTMLPGQHLPWERAFFEKGISPLFGTRCSFPNGICSPRTCCNNACGNMFALQPCFAHTSSPQSNLSRNGRVLWTSVPSVVYAARRLRDAAGELGSNSGVCSGHATQETVIPKRMLPQRSPGRDTCPPEIRVKAMLFPPQQMFVPRGISLADEVCCPGGNAFRETVVVGTGLPRHGDPPFRRRLSPSDRICSQGMFPLGQCLWRT